VDTISRVRPLLAPNTSRDLVFIEQRGTGASAMTCPAFPDLSDPAALRSAVESCVDSLDGDPRFYTTSLFADDVDEVLDDPHYPHANLVGISYGTAAEQVFLARHPDRVRTMTLLSGTLLDVPALERFPESAQRALDNVFAECERTAACQQVFPRLRADWDAMWRSVNAAPWVVPADRSPDGTEAVFDANRVASGLHDLLFIATTHTRIPVVVHTIGAVDDKVAALLAIAQAYPDTTGTGSGDEQMLGYLVRCNEAWARFDPDRLVGTDSFEYERVRNDAEWWQSVCSLIPEAGGTAAAAAPPTSDVHVLTLNGEADPQDPPANMAGAAAVWPNSLTLIVPAQGHDIDPVSAGWRSRSSSRSSTRATWPVSTPPAWRSSGPPRSTSRSRPTEPALVSGRHADVGRRQPSDQLAADRIPLCTWKRRGRVCRARFRSWTEAGRGRCVDPR
jgi:pimeloyl-ACP methyl ester carboxylesterase